MAEEKEEKHKKIQKEIYAVKSYLAKEQDEKDEARKKANEAIDYKFENLVKSDTRDKYVKSFFNHLAESAGKALKVDMKTLGYNSKEAYMLTQFYTGITYDEIKKIVESRGEKFKPDDLIIHISRNKPRFEQPHYHGIARHVETEEDIPEALKALGIEDMVEKEKVTLGHIPDLFAQHAGEGIHEEELPLEIRKKKKKAA